ncbi:MAG: hypothetical protein ACUVRX_04150 [Actinomycetota bacterium]
MIGREPGSRQGERSPSYGNLWNKALRLALSRRELWPAALLVTLGLSDAWRMLFGWDPEGVGERAAGWVRCGGGKGLADGLVLVLAATLAFLVLRGSGYLGEMSLIKRVAALVRGPGIETGDPGIALNGSGEEYREAKRPAPVFLGEGGTPGSQAAKDHPGAGTTHGAPGSVTPSAVGGAADGGAAWIPQGGSASDSRGTYLRLFAVLLPWDAARVCVVSMASLLVLLWGRWDPRLRLLPLYLLSLLLWFALFLATHLVLGVSALLAARQVVINGMRPTAAWKGGWEAFRTEGMGCVLAWLQALAADVAFLAFAGPLSAFLVWSAEQVAGKFRPAALEWMLRAPLYGLLASALLLGQVVTQAYKSSLWTWFFLSSSPPGPVVS